MHSRSKSLFWGRPAAAAPELTAPREPGRAPGAAEPSPGRQGVFLGDEAIPRCRRGGGTPGAPREEPGRPLEGCSCYGTRPIRSGAKPQGGGSGEAQPARPRDGRGQSPSARRSRGSAGSAERSGPAQPVPAANSPARPAAPGPAPAARRELLAVPPGAAQARRRRAGRAELRPGTAGGARGVRREPHLLCEAKRGFPGAVLPCSALPYPVLSSGQRRGLLVARRGPPLRAGPPAPLQRCPGRTWRSTAEINISACLSMGRQLCPECGTKDALCVSVCQAAVPTAAGNGAGVWAPGRPRREQPHAEPFGERGGLIVRRALITAEC